MSVSEQINAGNRRKFADLMSRNQLTEARNLCQDLLRDNPENSDAWRMLGVVAGRGGNATAAEQCMQKALRADTARGDAWFGYGQVLEMQGRPNDAGKAYLKAVELDPMLTEAHASLGALYLERSYFGHAIYHFQSALKLDQFRPELMIGHGLDRTSLTKAYGEALRSGGKKREALAVFESLLRERPDDPDLLYKIGNTYVQLAQLDDAYLNIRKGLEIAPGDTRLRVSEIKLLCLEKQFDEALEKLRPLIESAGDDIDVALSHAMLCQHSGDCDRAIDRLERIVNAGTANPRKRAMACFELGRLYDADGKYDQAFARYRQGNDMMKGSYDCESANAEVAAIIEGYNKETVAAASRARNSHQRPVFIIGMPRSGTTLVEQILASHPDVYGAGELAKIKELIRMYRQHQPGSMLDQIRSECRGFTTEVLDDLAGQYMEYIGGLAGDERYVTDKLPGNFFRLGAISLMFPKARIIHCRRNPIDTCLSCYFQNFAGYHPYTNDFESLANSYHNYRYLMAHWKRVIDLPILEVDYESLVDDQETETRRMLDFLELDWEDRCLRYYDSKRPTVTASYNQVNKPIYSSSVTRWKHYETHIAPLIDLLGGLAE